MISIESARTVLNVSIPEQLQNDSFRFIRLKPGDKIPVDKGWVNKNNYSHSDDILTKHISDGGNYGVLCVSGDVCILDADNHDRLLYLGAIDCFSDTLTIRTGSDDGERYHYYFRCSGLGKKKIPFYDLASDVSVHLGELYPSGSPAYCVGPSCLHPSGNTYRIVNDAEIKTIDISILDSVFFAKVKSSRTVKKEPEQLQQKMPRSDYKHSTLTDALHLRIEDIGYPAGNPVKRGDEIQGAHPEHGSSTGMNYSINPSIGAWHCYRCGSGGDALSFLAVKEGIIRCEDASDTTFTADQMTKLKEILATKYGYAADIKRLDYDFKTGINPHNITPDNLQKAMAGQRGFVFSPIIPEDNFIIEYADTICELTDSYRDYQLMAALMIIAITVQRKAVMKFCHSHVYPNIWIMLLGASSYSKKTTAISFCRNIINKITPTTGIAEDITPERFAQDVAEFKSVWQFVDEVSSLLEAMKKTQYMTKMREFLCSMYDNKPYNTARSRRKVKKGDTTECIIRDGYVNLMYATTPDMFYDSANSNDVRSGFFYRFLFCYPKYEKEMMVSREETEEQRKAIKHLELHAKLLYDYFHSFPMPEVELVCRMSDEALEWYQNWEMETETKYNRRQNKDGQNAYSRIKIITNKLMMLIEFGSVEFHEYIRERNYQMGQDDKWEIGIDTVKEVCRLAEVYFIPIFEEINRKIRLTDEKTVQDRILSAVDDFGGCMPFRDLKMRVRTNRRTDFEEAMRSLTSQEPEGTEELEVFNMVEIDSKGKQQMVRHVAKTGLIATELRAGENIYWK